MSSGTNKQKPKIPPKPPDILTKNRNVQSTSSSRTFPSGNNRKSRPIIPAKPLHLTERIKKNINHDASEERKKDNWASQNPQREDTHFKNKDEVSLKLDLAEGQTDVSKTNESQEFCSKEEIKCAFTKKSDSITCKTVNLEKQKNVDISALNANRTDTYEQIYNAKTQNKSKAPYANDGNTQRNKKENVHVEFDLDTGKSASTDVKQSQKQCERDACQNSELSIVHRETTEGCSNHETFNVTDTHSDEREFNAPPATNIKILEVVCKKMKTPPPAPPPLLHIRQPNTKLFYISTFDFGPEHSMYLKASKGELFEILNDDNKDNWIARNREGKEGLLPSKSVSDCPELDMYSWFYKDLHRPKCEFILCEVGKDGCFIVRQNDDLKYTLSVFIDDCSSVRVCHYPIYRTGTYFYLNKYTMFVSLPDLVEYHTRSGDLHTLLSSPPPMKYKETLEANDLEFSHTRQTDDTETPTLEVIYERKRTPISSSPPVTKLFYISTSNFDPVHHSCLKASKGELFEILNDNYEDKSFWMARNREGKEGLIPSKFVSDNPELDMYTWFYKDLHRPKCEFILREVGTDGCFIVWQNDELKYSLSVFTDDASGGMVNHYHIYQTGKYFNLRKHTMFVSLPDLLEYHTRRSGDLHTLLSSPPPSKYKETLEANELEYSHTHKLEIERTDLQFITKIGTGSFGEVHHGKLSGTDISAETIKDVSCAQDVLLLEARILSQLSHPNIVQLYGIVTKSLPVIKVIELMQNGNLLNHLRQNKFSLISDIVTLTNICRQVCSGLEYIHNRGYIHRNIAARSCLVGNNGTVKIADFSHAKYVRKEETITYTTYKFKWSPPEILYTQRGNFKSDIWSYGVLMWEICTCGKEPYSNVSNESYKKHIRSKKYRLLKPPTCSTTIYSIMDICWELDPSLRPTFKELLPCFEENNLKLIEKMINSEPQLPTDLGFDPHDRELFLLALKEGKESDKFLRVMVVGNFNQGKTSLTRRLLGLPLEGIESTDGIDIHKASCNISDFIWTKSENNSSETDGAHRLVKIVKQTKDSKSSSDFLMGTADDKETAFESSVESVNCSAEQDEIQSKDNNDGKDENEDQNGFGRHSNPDSVSSSDTSSSSGSSSELEESDESTDSMPDSNMTEMFQFHNNSHTLIKGINLLSGFSQKLMNESDAAEMSNAKDTNISIWDFGGQFIYYATHQIFHSEEAIYLLVFDLTKDLDCIVEDDDFPDRKTDMRTSMKFWVESVHAYVGTEDGHEPTIILVGTHKADCMSESYIEHKFDEVLDLFYRTKARNHIYKQPFAIEITDPEDPCIDEIRRTIVHIGLEKAKSREVPAKWIQLEVALSELRLERKIVKFAEVVDLDASTDSPIQDEEQIKVFLKYHHSKGTLVYFDESRLHDFVVIDPQFLVDAFKCIITSKRFCKWRPELHGLWQKLIESAVLEKYLLNSVWEHDKENMFMEHRDILLAFLQRHRILAEILSYDDVNCDERGTGKYIVPSLLKSECTHSTIQRVMHGKKCSMVILGFQLKESSIIKTIFERVIAAALGRWPPLEIDEKKLVFQSTVFYRLDLQHAGIISNPSENGIEMSVIAQCPPDGVEPDVCGHFRRFVEAVIQNEFQRHNSERQDKPYSFYIKCNHDVHNCKGSTHAHHGLDNIKKKYRVCCPDNESHAINTKQALGEWFSDQNVDKDERARNKKITEKDLAKIAQAIGKNWELLGPFLGLHDVDVQRIKQDHSFRSETAIYHMLNTWSKQNPKLDTLFDVLKVLKECEKVSVNWDKIYNILDEI